MVCNGSATHWNTGDSRCSRQPIGFIVTTGIRAGSRVAGGERHGGKDWHTWACLTWRWNQKNTFFEELDSEEAPMRFTIWSLIILTIFVTVLWNTSLTRPGGHMVDLDIFCWHIWSCVLCTVCVCPIVDLWSTHLSSALMITGKATLLTYRGWYELTLNVFQCLVGWAGGEHAGSFAHLIVSISNIFRFWSSLMASIQSEYEAVRVCRQAFTTVFLLYADDVIVSFAEHCNSSVWNRSKQVTDPEDNLRFYVCQTLKHHFPRDAIKVVFWSKNRELTMHKWMTSSFSGQCCRDKV